MKPGDGLLRFELLVVASLALIFAAFRFGSGSEEATAKHEKAAAEKKADIKPEDGIWMRLPLECETWIAQCASGQVCKRRYVCAADLTRNQ